MAEQSHPEDFAGGAFDGGQGAVRPHAAPVRAGEHAVSRVHNEVSLDAYWMPFTANRAFKQTPRLIEEASGMFCRTIDGDELLDAVSGLWCCNAGHCHPKIAEAIARQARQHDYSTAFQLSHPGVFELAHRLAEMAPGALDAVFFTNSGSESVDTALKIALAYWNAKEEPQRTRFVARERGYHGAGFGGTSVGGIEANREAFGALLPGVLRLPHTYDHAHQAFSRGQPEWGAHLADALEDMLEEHGAETVAAVIVEPFSGSAGVLVPPVGYLERLREITARHGILLIFDEVITAFGRTGAAFAAQRFGVEPDMITIAKGITSGAVPMGAVLVRRDIRQTILDAAGSGIEFFHGYTYSGHPLAVAAAHAALDVYEEEDLFGNVRRLEGAFEDVLHDLADCPHVRDIRNIGFAGAIELEPKPDAPTERATQVFARAFDDGLLLRTTGDTVAVAPSLIATEAHIEQIGRLLRRALG